MYNSLKDRVSNSLLKQVSLLLDTDCKNIKLIVEDTQIQKVGSDCGLFAIASATALCYGMSPIKCQWDQSLMRDHLKICFNKEHFQKNKDLNLLCCLSSQLLIMSKITIESCCLSLY